MQFSEVFYRDDFVGVPFCYRKNIHILQPAYLIGTYLFDVGDVTFSPILVARNADRVVLVVDAISGKRSRNLNRSIIREISKKFLGEYDVVICAAGWRDDEQAGDHENYRSAKASI